jgi:hypothetical protein
MIRKLVCQREKTFTRIRLGMLCRTARIRIFLTGVSLSRKKGLRAILSMLTGILLLVSPSLVSAQTPETCEIVHQRKFDKPA